MQYLHSIALTAGLKRKDRRGSNLVDQACSLVSRRQRNKGRGKSDRENFGRDPVGVLATKASNRWSQGRT